MPQVTSTIELTVRDMADFETRKDECASIILYGPEGVEIVHLSSPHETVVIGRAHPSDVRINEPSLSRQHARFRWAENQLTVTDLDSQNGIWIGNNRVKSSSLSSGEHVYLGNVLAIVAIKVDEVRGHPTASAKISNAEGIVIRNHKMKQLYEEVTRASSNSASVLVLGETGTGKEHVARAIHSRGNRKNKPFVAVNCGAIPRTLLESQLFGYRKGAFTGALNNTAGFFEEAQGGVIFLDEIGEMSLSAQAALLRAVDTKKITRVGSTKEIDIDVRIVTATHCRLEAMIKEGAFRNDLFYRLNTITFELPPLRERIDEMEPLTELFLENACVSWGQPRKRIHPEVIEKLKQYKWPGNIRQLRNVIERCVLSCRDDTIGLADLPQFVIEADQTTLCSVPPSTLSPPPDDEPKLSYKERLRKWEIDVISEAMHRANGSKRAAARFLRIPRSSLIGKIEMLGLTDMRWGEESTRTS